MKVLLRCILGGFLFLFLFWQSNWAKSIDSAPKNQKVVSHDKLETGEEPLNAKTLSAEFGTHGSYGGPNSYNYHWVDSDTNLGVTYNWIEISGIGTLIDDSEWYTYLGPNPPDDGTAGPFYLGFSFPYCDSSYDSIYIGTNGVLSFSDSELTYDGYFGYYNTTATIPYMRFANAISPLFVDINLDPDTNLGGGYVYYWKNAAEDSFIVEYKDVRPFVYDGFPNDSAAFEVIFTTTDTSITFQYQHVEFHDSVVSWNPQGFDVNELSLVGIQDKSKKIGLRYHSGYQQWWYYEEMNNAPHDGLAVKFKRDGVIQHNLTPIYCNRDSIWVYEPYNSESRNYSWDIDEQDTIPTLWFFNTGRYQETGIPINCNIYTMDTTGNAVDFVKRFSGIVSDIGAHDSAQAVFFENWQPPARGRYKMVYTSNLVGDELPLDDSLKSTIYAERRTILSEWASIVPTCNGQIEALEWSDAFKQDISYFKGGDIIAHTSPYLDSNAAYLYVKNDSNFLYLAIDAKADTSDTPKDRVKIVMDDNANGVFEADSSEGFLVLWNYPFSEDSLFFTEETPKSNLPPDYGVPCDTYAVAGMNYGFGRNGSNMQVEMAIPFGDGHWKINKTTLDSIGICVYYLDLGALTIAYWPYFSNSHYYASYLGRMVFGSATDVKDGDRGEIPRRFALSQNYPNPFNPSTIIEYYLAKPCHVTLNIYNVLGQKVRTLKDEYQGIGKKTVGWEGKDDKGKDMPSGAYFYKLKAGDLTESRKMLLVR